MKAIWLTLAISLLTLPLLPKNDPASVNQPTNGNVRAARIAAEFLANDQLAGENPTFASIEDLVYARLQDPAPQQVDADLKCLAQAVYFEARSEPLEGQLAVAQVVLNRANDTRFPSTACGVVFQNEHRFMRCQFSFACDGRSDRPREARAWQMALVVAAIADDGEWEDITNAATHYHADYVEPYWMAHLEPTVTHGQHIFYRDASF
ncbi:MAG: cell wall hydrolase [Pseudomonadota bacterium]